MPLNLEPQGSKRALGIFAFVILSWLPQEAHAQLSASRQSQINALIVRIAQCWKLPAGAAPSTEGHVSLRVQFKLDGSLAGEPVVVENTVPANLGPPLAKSAIQSLKTCQPFTMLKPEDYGFWKEIQIDFSPKMLLGH